MPSVLRKAAVAASVAIGLYATVLGLLLTPDLQRFALYANKFNTIAFDNLHDARKFGFAKNQVTPFNIATPDGALLYAWHILPIDTYTRHESRLRYHEPPQGPVADVQSTLAFKLLTTPEPTPARVIVSFHGNAGHIAQGKRPETLRMFSTLPNTHVFTIDYRGFGHSTGSPTEAGLIVDGISLLNWILNVAKVPPERIVIVGQSLGTAVASAVGLHFAWPDNDIDTGRLQPLLGNPGDSSCTTFAGIVLVAPFSNIPSLLLSYRIGGFLPILMPLSPLPWITARLTSRMIDKWFTADKLAAYSMILAESDCLRGPDGRSMGALHVVHALNDAEISSQQTTEICRTISGDVKNCANSTDGPSVVDFHRERRVKMRFEFVEYGGHNKIVAHTHISGAVIRAFDGIYS